MRGTYAYWDFDQRSEARRGDLEFNIFRLFVDLASKGFLVSAQYRWYSYMHVIHHGWVGYDVPVNRGPLSMLTFYNDFRLGHMSGRSKSWSSFQVAPRWEMA